MTKKWNAIKDNSMTKRQASKMERGNARTEAQRQMREDDPRPTGPIHNASLLTSSSKGSSKAS